MNTIIYKESQRFNQPLLWVTLLSVYIPFHVWGIRKLLNESSKGNVLLESETVQAAVIGIVLLNFLVVLFLFIKLETKIDASGIHFRYFPIINSWREMLWKDILSVEIIQYSPWAYGGWGIRYSWLGWAYNVRGNKGIMIKKKNGRRILIGTQKMMDAKDAIESLMRQEKYDYGQ